MKTIKLKEQDIQHIVKRVLKETVLKIINEKTMEYFPVNSDNFNVGYDEEGLEIWDGMSKGRREKKEEVKDMQQLLIDRNYVLPRFGVDGKFGTETLAAVKAFQRDYMEEVTGKVTLDMIELLQNEENINQNPEMNDPTEVKKISKKKQYNDFSPEVIDAIQQAADNYNISIDVLLTIANIESGGNPSAKNSRSGASGLFQILPKYFDSYGVTNTTVWDPYVNSDAAANKLYEKVVKLTRFLGRAPTDAELYISHNQGTTGFKVIYIACENYGDLEGKESLQKAAVEMGYKKSYGTHIWNNMKGDKGNDPCIFLDNWSDIYANKASQITHLV